MKAAVYRGPGAHHQSHAEAMVSGLKRHAVDISTFGNRPDNDADFCTVWGWRAGARIRDHGFDKPILVLERGYLGDRFFWTSLGWDGLNGRARWNAAQDNGERFWRHHGHLACEWEHHDGYALIIGQVPGDMALEGVNIDEWYREAGALLWAKGIDTRFRPHPEAVKRGHISTVPPHVHIEGTLDEAFSGASMVVTWNSNAAVDAALAGIPTIAMDEGSMAWPVAAHSLAEPLVTPDRDGWFRDLAWRQWTADEIASGLAWEVVREAM